jgi:large subunit ribosomal protein L15
MKLHTLTPAAGSTRETTRVGRGEGSTRGGTSTRGHKGAGSRSGHKNKRGFEGGQMPLQRRVPKFGFTNAFRVSYKVVNLDTLQELAEQFNTTEIDQEFLQLHGIVSKNDLVKVLGRGEVKAKLTVKANKFSQSAKAAIEAAGGTATEA